MKGNEDQKAGFEDRTVRFNVMRSRATKIQELTKTFREAQRNYLQNIIIPTIFRYPQYKNLHNITIWPQYYNIYIYIYIYIVI